MIGPATNSKSVDPEVDRDLHKLADSPPMWSTEVTLRAHTLLDGLPVSFNGKPVYAYDLQAGSGCWMYSYKGQEYPLYSFDVFTPLEYLALACLELD